MNLFICFHSKLSKDDLCLRIECSCAHNRRLTLHCIWAFWQNNSTDIKQQTCGFHQSSSKSKSKNTCKKIKQIIKKQELKEGKESYSIGDFNFISLNNIRIRKLVIEKHIKKIKMNQNHSLMEETMIGSITKMKI